MTSYGGGRRKRLLAADLRNREENGEGGALAQAARHFHVAAVRERDGLDDAEAEAEALARTRLVHAVEAVENMRELFVGDPHPRVGHVREREVAVALERHAHRSRGLRVFDRVVDKVDEKAPQLVLVPEDGHRL